MKTYVHLWCILLNSPGNETFFRKSCRENRNTHFMFFVFVLKMCHLWDNVEKYGRAVNTTDDNIIWHMHFERWITEATNTLRKCSTYYFSTATVVTQMCFSVTLYIHCLSLLALLMLYTHIIPVCMIISKSSFNNASRKSEL